MNYLYCSLIIIIIIIIIFYIENIKRTTIVTSKLLIQKYPLWPLFKFYIKSKLSIEELNNLVNYNQLPILNNYIKIPNILFQTYYNKNKIPNYVFERIQKYANNYEYILYDDIDAEIFLTKYFNSKVVRRFNKLRLGAHKADLLRYCFLYVYGGIYIDIKTLLIKPLDEIFTNKYLFYTCIANFDTVIYNGLIASKARNPLFLSLIWYIIDIPIYIINEPTKIISYLTFCLDLYKKIQYDLNTTKKLTMGLHKGKTQDYYLFKEVSTLTITDTCTKFDRYGGCQDIYDKNNKIFIGRDPDFPWK